MRECVGGLVYRYQLFLLLVSDEPLRFALNYACLPVI